MEKEHLQVAGILLGAFIVLALLVFGTMGAWANLKVYTQEKEGLAEFKRAEQNRLIKIEEAKAMKEAAVYQAEAEQIRATGVAGANKIIGDSLKDSENYLKYLWITGAVDSGNTGNTIIYVPTEASLPILEAGRFKQPALNEAAND